MAILTEFTLWLTPFCLLLGAIYAYFMYFLTSRESVGIWFLRFMILFRFLTISVIAFLLLSPVLRWSIQMMEKPVIIIGTDNSASMVQGGDSLFVSRELPALISGFREQLKDYDVRSYSFGEQLASPEETGFRETRTDMAAFFTGISSLYLNRNVGAVVVFSDGIVNYGADPVYTSRDIPWPVFTVAIGDTSVKKDLKISRVFMNKQVFLDDQFPVEIFTDAVLCNGEQVELSVIMDGKQVFTKPLLVTGVRFSDKTTVMLPAAKPGWLSFTIVLTPVAGELSIENNRRDLYVEVIEEQLVIALVSDAPHPDINAMMEALSGNRKYDIRQYSTDAFLTNTDSADLVILYQVPSMRGARIPEAVLEKFPSILYVLGSQSDLGAFNALKSGLNIESSRLTFADAYPQANRKFSYFAFSDHLNRIIPGFPPLLSPFASYQSSPLLETSILQQINGLSTSFPLIAFLQEPNQKKGFICGENIWRWRLSAFMQEGDHQGFDELVRKIVQYLVIRQDRSLFRIHATPEYKINESVVFTAGLLNQSYQPVIDAHINMEIADAQEHVFSYVFAPSGTSYYLNAGKFPQGVYQYRATVDVGNEHYEKRGSFVISPVQLEAIQLVADHQLLERLATSHNGKRFYPDQLSLLVNEISANESIRPVSYTQRLFTDLISFPWLFGAILLLITAEWVFRKYTGLS